MAEQKMVDRALLKTLVPPSALNAENFQELAGKAVVEELPPGRTLFKIGETDRKTTYLLEGEVVLTSNRGQTSSVIGGSNLAKHPLASSATTAHRRYQDALQGHAFRQRSPRHPADLGSALRHRGQRVAQGG